MAVEFRISSLGGNLCTVSLNLPAPLTELQAAIEASTGIEADSQRLFHGLHELNDDVDLAELRCPAQEIASGATGERKGAQADPALELMLLRGNKWLRQLEALQVGDVPRWFAQLPVKVQADREVMLATAAKRPSALKRAAHSLRANPEFVREAVSKNPLVLGFASKDLLEDREFVLSVLGECGLALGGLDAQEQCDREFVLAALAQNGKALYYASPLLQASHECVLAAVRQDGAALCFAAPELLGDRRVALAAVAQNGMALRFVAPGLQGDEDVVLAALAQDLRVLRYVRPEVKRRRQIRALLAQSKGGRAVKTIPTPHDQAAANAE